MRIWTRTITAAIPGTKRRRYLEDNVAASDVMLNREELERIEAIAPQSAAAGLLYPEAMMKSVDA